MNTDTQKHSDQDLKQTPLHKLHVELGGKMVPFAGYDMPVQYPAGIMAEHLHTRAQAGLFDVSHMGQASLIGPDHETTAAALEALTPGNFLDLKPGRQRYTLLLNEKGGVIDDLMVSRPAGSKSDGTLFLIVNAARKHVDYAHIENHLSENVTLHRAESQALLALQGPKAAEVLMRHSTGAGDMKFMDTAHVKISDIDCHISRSGYTGEDGYEISVAQSQAEALARILLAEPEVDPIGLGARDSLRLEAGLCLYGHDIDEAISPVEAGLIWAIAKRRRETGGFPGATQILRELETGPKRCLVGIRPQGRAPAREGTVISSSSGEEIGIITSGGFAPSVKAPIAMGYVEASYAKPDTTIILTIRDKPHEASIAGLPFVPHHYVR